MSFPATGLETTYRNAINDVAKLLKKKHQDNYLVSLLISPGFDFLKYYIYVRLGFNIYVS